MVQSQILQLINLNFPSFRAGAEVTVHIGPTRYFVPDIVIQESDHIQRPYPSEPPICVWSSRRMIA